MEQQMKIMVERMRYYQAADPVTFQTVWDNVRKNGNAGGAGGEEQRAIMPAAAGMVRSESAASEQTAVYTPLQGPEKVAKVKGGNATPRYAQQVQYAQPTALPPTQTQTQPEHQLPPSPPPPPPPPPLLNPSQVALHLRTAQAVSKYLVKTSGHCLPEEVIVDLLHRIKSFPVLCDKLESMGYQFHRGGFSRFLLAEVDGSKDEAEAVEKEVAENNDVVMTDETDNGGSRVLGEISDDQEQILNEARDAEAGRMVNGPTPSPPVQPVKMGRRRPAKLADSQKAAQPPNTTTVAAPETPTVSTRQRTALPTPVSAAPVAPMAPLDGPASAARMVAPIFRAPSHLQPEGDVFYPLSDDQQSPSPGPDFARHPTPQSVKAAHAAPPRVPEMKQFVSPSLVYRPPTPPLVIDVDSSSTPTLTPTPTPPETHSPMAADEVVPLLDSPQRERRTSLQSGPSSRNLTKIVKLRLQNLKTHGQNMQATNTSSSSPSPAPADCVVQKPIARGLGRPGRVVIDLTASATPEPQMNRVTQPPASAPDPRNLTEKKQQWLGPRNSEPSSTPLIQQPILIPQTAPVIRSVPAEDGSVLFNRVDKKEPLQKLQYNPATIARDILIAAGRSPGLVRPLNAHLDTLRTRGLVTMDADLETVRWDLLTPGPVGFAVGYDARIDDDDDGGYGGESGGADVAVARVPAMLNNRAAIKGMAGHPIAPSPTPAARGRARVRKSGTLGAAVMGFENPGVTTASNGTGRQATSTNGNGNSNGTNNRGARTNSGSASWGGFSVPTPRSGSRTGSGLRHVLTPDVGANFSVVIRSSSASSVDRNRAPESTNGRNLKRKLDGSDKEKDTPATKKAAKPARLSGKKKEKAAVMEMRPSEFKVFKCRWKLCPAELHNFETLHRHVIKAHCKLADYGGYPCHWTDCSRSPTKEMKRAAAASRGPGKVVASRFAWDFDTPEQWEAHVLATHLDSVKNEIGVGPFVGPYGAFYCFPPPAVRGSADCSMRVIDHEAAGSDVDYLSDSFGHQVTPVARPAPLGHVFLPPPGYEFSSPQPAMSRHIQRARSLGAGMEGDETADLRESDDGHGIHLAVRRIVAAEDRATGSQGVKGSSRSPSEGAKAKTKAKAKGKGKEKAVEKENPLEDLGRGSDEAGPSNFSAGAFTIYDDDEYCL